MLPSSPFTETSSTPPSSRRQTFGSETSFSRHVTSRLINDDVNEKKQRQHRRQSARDELLRRKSMLISPNKVLAQTPAADGGPVNVVTPRRKAAPIDVEILAPKIPALSKEQMYVNYEEWMKMATDNKINAANSWNFALIDYFHEMTFLRDGDSINFQKASCTLDGCVKIYTSRVDSVASETGKLLSGLADSSKDERDAGDDEDDDGEGAKRARRRGNRSSEATLVRDFSMLKVKKLELEFAVDPLFKKTSADFDEGGARGLLLNHLSVDPDGRIIFDAGDAKAEGDEEGEEEGGGEEEGMKEEGVKKEKEGEAMEVDGEDEGKGKKTEKGEEEEAKLIDVSKLKVKFLPNMDELLSYDICPSLKDFTFATDASELPFLRSHTDEDEDPTSMIANPVGDDDDDDDLGDYFGEDNGVSNADDDDSSIVVVAAPGTAAPFDPAVKSLKEKDYMMAMAGEENEMFSYFDSAFMRSWAGPEHWKMRRAVVKIDKPATAELVDGTEGDEGAAPTGAKKKREAFSVNFVGGEDVDEKVLFARAPKRRSIKLIETKEGGAKHLLPDDMNFSSKQLLRMFARPNFSIHTRKHANKEKDTPVPSSVHVQEEEEEVNEQFWADQVDAAPDGPEGQASGEADRADSPDLDLPFLFHDVDVDDDDDPFGDAEGDVDDIPVGGDSHGYGDNLIAASLRKVKPAYVNYAKTAKKVDVKKLKDNLWREMTVGNGTAAGAAAAQEDVPEDATVVGRQKFTEIVSGLDKVYPEKKRKDISVPFCFICLLHLANEKNLVIEKAGGDGLDDLIVMQDG